MGVVLPPKLPLSDPRSIIIKMIENTPNITRKTIAEELGLTIDGTRYHLKKLTEDGVIKYVGTSRKRYWELLKKIVLIILFFVIIEEV